MPALPGGIVLIAIPVINPMTRACVCAPLHMSDFFKLGDKPTLYLSVLAPRTVIAPRRASLAPRTPLKSATHTRLHPSITRVGFCPVSKHPMTLGSEGVSLVDRE
uniref:Secreted protein n=1 Tax=Mesocestoides corti TaxID=53468 RepID=A0A5K3G2E1_MESCO